LKFIGIYDEVGTKNGVLKHKYMRSQFAPCKEILLDLKTLLESSGEKEITLQKAVGYNSLMGTQGGRNDKQSNSNSNEIQIC